MLSSLAAPATLVSIIGAGRNADWVIQSGAMSKLYGDLQTPQEIDAQLNASQSMLCRGRASLGRAT
jgi:hypothetical protein